MDHLIIPFQELYRANQLPVFQNKMFPSAQQARECPKGDVVLIQNLITGLIYNQAFDPKRMLYDRDYQNEQSLSQAFMTHLESVSGIIHRHLEGRELIEVGCGKGYFLEYLQAKGFSITGFDPAYEGCHPSITRQFFTPQMGLKADGLILRHVLEHIKEPMDFLKNLALANGGKGLIYIEVPCLDWICKHRSWMDIFYEHANYFRLNDFHRIFGRVVESSHTFGGQYLSVLADLATLQDPVFEEKDRVSFPKDFLETVHHHASRLLSSEANGQRRQSAVWGGASKGVIFSLFMQRAGAAIQHVIDLNPAKQGKFLAATGLRVESPEEALTHLPPGSELYVMNQNYLEEIQERTGHQYVYLTVS